MDFDYLSAADMPARGSHVEGGFYVHVYFFTLRFRPMWLLLIQVGFVGFLLSLFGLVWRGFDREGAVQRGAVAWSIATALFFLLWLLALSRFPAPYPN